MLSDDGPFLMSFSCLRAMAFNLPISSCAKKLCGIQPNNHSSDSPSGERSVEEAPKEFLYASRQSGRFP